MCILFVAQTPAPFLFNKKASVYKYFLQPQ
jgi:hypothetical protein